MVPLVGPTWLRLVEDDGLVVVRRLRLLRRLVVVAVLVELLQVRLDVRQVQDVAAGPVVDDGRDGAEAGGVAAVLEGREAAAREEVAVDELVDERRDQQVAVVPRVAEDRARQRDAAAEAAVRVLRQRGAPHDAAVVLGRGADVGPGPRDALREPVGEEDGVDGEEDAAEGVLVEELLLVVLRVGGRVDE